MRINQNGYLTMIYSDEINTEFWREVKDTAPFDLVGPYIIPEQPETAVLFGNFSERLLESVNTDEND